MEFLISQEKMSLNFICFILNMFSWMDLFYLFLIGSYKQTLKNPSRLKWSRNAQKVRRVFVSCAKVSQCANTNIRVVAN